ncbi:MAG TPA: hypothetical protein VLV83_08550 [Acidobacteriota bacterium]|nr:hypothetical protein [Acidobacteriota bacterium]
MNWGRIVLGGLAAGVVKNLVDFAIHAGVLASTYDQYDLFRVEPPPSPLYFFLVAICIGLAAAIFFAKTRSCWAEGAAGGANFGFWLGLVAFFGPFYHPLTIAGFPYFLSWYWGIISVVSGVIAGAVLGLIVKR